MRLLPWVLFVVCACSGRIKPIDPLPPDAGCGDGLINAMLGEECEGSDLNGATCQSLGFDEGALSCSACKLVKTLCVKRCGNGVIDTGETCDGDAGVLGCTDFGYVSCTASCQLDRTRCVTSPYQAANGALILNPGGPAVIADLPPRGLGDLVIVVEGRFRVESSPYTVQMGFLPNTSKYSFGADPVQAIAQGFDIVALNRDGALDRYAYDAGLYAVRPFPDAGCTGRIIGELSDGAIATTSCDAGEVLVWSASVTRARSNGGVCALADWDRNGSIDVLSLSGTQLDVHAAPSFGASDAGVLPVALTFPAAADFDGDGDLDLAGIVGANVKLIENTGATGFADRLSIPSAGAAHLRGADLDLDGRVDLVWEAGDKALIRRNQGSWVFAPFEATFSSNMGASLSFSVGDVDGDGDLDLVTTRAGAGTTSTSYTQLNRVR